MINLVISLGGMEVDKMDKNEEGNNCPLATQDPEVNAKNKEKAIEEAKESQKSDDVATLNAATEKLTQASYKLAEILYKDQQAAGQQQGKDEPSGGNAEEDKTKDDDDGVIDAEVVN